jgi:phasin family protein
MATKKTGKKTIKVTTKATKPAKTVSAKQAAPAQALTIFKKMETKTMNTNKQFEKFSQDAANIGQEQVEALVKSGTILAKGMEDIMKTVMNIAQSSTEKSQEAAKAMMSCKTLNEFTEAQTKLAQSSFDDFMATATKLSELSIKVATDSLEPINDQVGKAMKKAAA